MGLHESPHASLKPAHTHNLRDLRIYGHVLYTHTHTHPAVLPNKHTLFRPSKHTNIYIYTYFYIPHQVCRLQHLRLRENLSPIPIFKNARDAGCSKFFRYHYFVEWLKVIKADSV